MGKGSRDFVYIETKKKKKTKKKLIALQACWSILIICKLYIHLEIEM